MQAPKPGAAQERQLGIAVRKAGTEAAEKNRGPSKRAQRSGRMPAPPGCDQIRIEEVCRSDADRKPHHQPLIIGIEDMEQCKPRARRRPHPEIRAHQDAVDDRKKDHGREHAAQAATACGAPHAPPHGEQDHAQYRGISRIREIMPKNGAKAKTPIRRVHKRYGGVV